MSTDSWFSRSSPAFRLMIATSWLTPESWQDKQEHAIRGAVTAGVDWTEYLNLVERHRTPALSWSALGRVPLDLPDFVTQPLKQGSDACRMSAVRHALMLAQVLESFQRAQIPVIPMKGPLLSLALYRDVGLRQSKDLDIMVAPEDIQRARTCLEAIGWRPGSDFLSLSPRQWDACLKHDRHIGFAHSAGAGNLELHWRCIHWDTSEQTIRRWARAAPSSFQGHPYLALHPIDLALYLCSHGSEHAWFRAKWLGDLACMHAAESVDWKAALDEACRVGQDRPLLLCLGLLNDAYGLVWPVSPSSRKGLPFLIDTAAISLRDSAEPDSLPSIVRLRRRIRKTRYEQLLRPDRSWRKSLAGLSHQPQDFQALKLPDNLFWVYIPLHPFLWAWRWLQRGRFAHRTGK